MTHHYGCFTRLGRTLFLAVLTLSVVARLPAADDASSANVNDIWKRSVALVEKGQFSSATDLISRVADSYPLLERAAGWLDQFRQLEQKRSELAAADYAKYVGWTQQRLAKGDTKDVRIALNWARAALDNAGNRRDVLDAEWMQDLRRAALDKADELYRKSEWLDAFATYGELSGIYEDDQDLEARKRDCLSHARLEAVYGKDNPRWRERLQGVDPEPVRDALYWIDRRYVETADFRKLTLDGYHQMLLLAESKALHDAFEPLQDDSLRGEFVNRVQAQLRNIQSATRIGKKEAIEYFNNTLKINRQTVNLPEALIISEYVVGMSDALDEFTSLIWPVEFKEFEKHTRGDFVGVGISIQENKGKIVVVSPLEDTPAYRAGIQAGDEISKVDNESTEGMSLTKAVQTITGPVGTSVTLTIHRKGAAQDFPVPLKREVVKIQSVKGIARNPTDDQRWNFVLDPENGVGYVRITTFQENTVKDLRAALADLERKPGFNLKGLILDLRDNPGGLLSAAVDMADLFLPDGAKVVSTRDRENREQPINASGDGGYDNLPLIVLVNGNSASASEIVSGALKDHKRGTLIGEKTFGKFSVQNLIQLSGSEAHLKLTTAHYYLPSGRSLHHRPGATEWGVSPDVDLKLVRKEYIKLLEMRRKLDVIGSQGVAALPPPEDENDDGLPDEVQKSGDETGKPAENAPEHAVAEADKLEKDPNDRPEVDPQLEAAKLIMRVRLLSEQNPMIAQRAKVDAKVER
ncbi:MAG TPA: S41 family peptidase [Phycisphaerae bacterium]|jgi:carboxyl-terminal processing protease